MAVTKDNRAVSLSSDATLIVWDLTCMRQLRSVSLTGDEQASALAITPDGRRVIVASGYTFRDIYQSSYIQVFEIWSGRNMGTWNGEIRAWVDAMAALPDGRHILYAARDNNDVKLCDLSSADGLRRLRGHREQINALAVTPDGRRAVSASGDATLRVWDLTLLEEVACFSADGSLHPCVISPDGTTVLAGDISGQVHFLRLVE